MLYVQRENMKNVDEECGDSPLIRVNGISVHRGLPEPGADLEQIVDAVREERIQAIIRMALPDNSGEERKANSE
jgi:hypothetical protein